MLDTSRTSLDSRQIGLKLSLTSVRQKEYILENSTHRSGTLYGFTNGFGNISGYLVPEIKRQIVKVDSKASASSLSILTLPFPVPGGVRAAVDVFGDDPDLMETQLMAQIKNLKSRIGQRNTTDLFLTVTVPQSLTDHCDRLADQKGLEKYRLPRGKLNRRVIKMFVYEKSMNE